jgi:thiol-disulfide isomerase/thioredoxin
MRTSLSWILGILALSAVSLNVAIAQEKVSTDQLGKSFEKLSFGNTESLKSVSNRKATVIVLLSFDCPVSNSYVSTLNDLAKEWAPKGVTFVGIAPNEEKENELNSKAKDFGLKFPVYRDPNFTIIEGLKATKTPEAFVLDSKHILRYRGRIDNSFHARLKKNNQTTEFDLVNAINDLVANKPVRVPATETVGCPVPVKESSERKVTTKLTFHKDMLPILQARCQECHRPGDVGPFSLLTYKQTVNWADDIKEYTQNKKMPPWKPGVGLPFRNERSMPEKEIAMIREWVDGGMPEGNPEDAPKTPKKFTTGWQLGEPDLILSADEDFHLGASGPDNFRCMVLPTGLTEDKFVVAYEIKPGTPQVVHHSLNFYDLTGKARELQAKAKAAAKPTDLDRGPGYSVGMGLGFIPSAADFKPGAPDPIKLIGGWAPGQVPTFMPDDTGYFIPKGADLVLQIHYHRVGKPEKDRTKIGLYFAKKPVKKPFHTLSVDGMPALTWIPANTTNHVKTGSLWVTEDCQVHSLLPHMHLLGKSVKMTMTSPEGVKTTLIDIPEWDYNWQETYWLKNPIDAKAWTRFDIEAVFDNSSSNPNNPNSPPKPVFRGEETTNEMLFGFLGATKDGPGRVRASRIPPPPKKD